MEVLQNQQQRRSRGDRRQRLADLAQHTLARGAQNLLLEGLSMLPCEQRRELDQPGGGLHGERVHHGGPVGPATQSPNRLEHR